MKYADLSLIKHFLLFSVLKLYIFCGRHDTSFFPRIFLSQSLKLSVDNVLTFSVLLCLWSSLQSISSLLRARMARLCSHWSWSLCLTRRPCLCWSCSSCFFSVLCSSTCPICTKHTQVWSIHHVIRRFNTSGWSKAALDNVCLLVQTFSRGFFHINRALRLYISENKMWFWSYVLLYVSLSLSLCFEIEESVVAFSCGIWPCVLTRLFSSGRRIFRSSQYQWNHS